MCAKTEDKQLNIFMDSEKLILKVCSRTQRDRRKRASGQGYRYVRTTARRDSGTEREREMKGRRRGRGDVAWLSAFKCVHVCVIVSKCRTVSQGGEMLE